MKPIRGVLKKTAQRLLPLRWFRILRRPALVPGEYARIIKETEYIIDIQAQNRSLDSEYWAAVLRKNAHILDKGLQREDWEPNHGALYHDIAHGALAHIPAVLPREDPSLLWAVHKLGEYEKAEAGHASVQESWEVEADSGRYEALQLMLKQRRSARHYKPTTVEEGVIQKIVDGMNWCPTSCNRQTAKVFATNHHDLARACLDTCKGGTGFGAHIPAFLCFCADLRPYELPAETWLPFIDVALGTENCCLLAHSLGLSLTLLSWAQSSEEEERRLRQLLDIPSYYRIIVNGTLGYPRYMPATPLRKPVSSTLVLQSQGEGPGGSLQDSEQSTG